MRKRPKDALYETLSPEQLFPLAVSAFARGDVSEGNHVLSKVPLGYAEVRHPAFDRMLDGTRALLDTACPFIGHLLGWLEALDYVAPLVLEILEALLGVYDDGTTDAPDIGIGRQMKACIFAFLRAELEAFCDVTAEHGLDGHDVLRALMPGLAGQLARVEEQITGARADKASKEVFVGVLRAAWDVATS